MKDIAIFGGTFDPPTRAHEGIIRACLDHPEIDEVWLMPSGLRADKPHMSANQARLDMLRLVREEVFGGEQRLVVSDFEQRLPQPTETRTTVKELKGAYPDHTFWFVFGADSYQSMENWNQGEVLRRNLGMLLVNREGFERPPEGGNIRHLAVEISDDGISSSAFREALQAAVSAERLVSSGVMRYVREQALYDLAVIPNPAESLP